MKLRGIARLAAVAATSVLLVGAFGAPARAEVEEEFPDFPGATLNLVEPVWAATAPNKGCAGIDTGVAVPGKDGWLFSKPRGEYTDPQYLLLYIEGDVTKDDYLVHVLILQDDGVFTFDLEGVEDPTADDLAALQKGLNKATAKFELPLKPAPAGVTGALTADGSWLKTPAGWLLATGSILTDPMLEKGTYDLVRACAAANVSPTPSAPGASVSPTPVAGPQLPVTGTNVWLLTGGGAALIAVGAVLFMAYRRRQGVKFVA